jgi:hypothetical protein
MQTDLIHSVSIADILINLKPRARLKHPRNSAGLLACFTTVATKKCNANLQFDSLRSTKAFVSKRRAAKATVSSMDDLMSSCISSTACRSKKSRRFWSGLKVAQTFRVLIVDKWCSLAEPAFGPGLRCDRCGASTYTLANFTGARRISRMSPWWTIAT